MDVSYYYHVLEIGIIYEKGGKRGKHWRIGEKKRLRDEVLFWNSLLEFVIEEENGINCSEKMFKSLEKLCKKYNFPNYERIIKEKDKLISTNEKIGRNKNEIKIYNFIKKILYDLQKNLDTDKDKERFFHLLTVLHNLPKSMHGQTVLNANCNLITCEEAIIYAQGCMDERMKKEYKEFFD